MACGKHFKVYVVGAFSAIGGFLFGYHTGVISGVLTMQDFKDKMKLIDNNAHNQTTGNIPDIRTSGIVAILLFGCFLGSLIGGQTSDRISRKYSISVFSFIFTISAAFQTASPGYIILLFGRFFAGISIGALSMIVPIYHSEIAATKVRGRIITLQQWAITIGIATSFWINFGTHNSRVKDRGGEWRIPLGLQMVPSLILAIGILFCPFSPRWLICHDREDEARDVLMKIRSASHDEIEAEMDRIKNEVTYLCDHEIKSYRQLFRAPLLRPFLLGIGIQILQQLTGINSTIYYAPEIFTNIFGTNNHTLDIALLATGVDGCVNVIATIPAIIFIDKLGRRVLLITGAIIMCASLLIVGILDATSDEDHRNKSTSWIIIVFIFIFVGGFGFSWGPVAWIYCAEIFPLTIRAKATSITTAANWATNCVISFLVLILFRQNPAAFFLIFSGLCGLMIGIVHFFYPETKNIHLEEMDVIGVLNSKNSDDRKTDYETFPEQEIVNRTQVIEQNSRNQSNQINNSNSISRDDAKTFDSNVN